MRSTSYAKKHPALRVTSVTLAAAGWLLLALAVGSSAMILLGHARPGRGQIVFTGDRSLGSPANLYTYDLDQRVLHPLTRSPLREQAPVYSPDGRYIAFLRSLSPAPGRALPEISVYLMDRSGRGMRRLHTMPEGTLINQALAWSPDSRYLAFTQVSNGTQQAHLNLYDVHQRRLVQTHPIRQALSVAPLTWSADGCCLVFWVIHSREEIHVVTYDTDAQALTLERRWPIGDQWSVGRIVPAPDGRHFVTSMQAGRSGVAYLYHFDRTAGVASRLAPARERTTEIMPAWSPHDDRLAFVQRRLGDSRLAWVTLAQPDSVHPLTDWSPARITYPDWSPRGDWIAFRQLEASGRERVCLAPVAGGSIECLPVWMRSFTWRP